MNKKYHEKFKILDILAVTIQAREGIETCEYPTSEKGVKDVTIQAREGIETLHSLPNILHTVVTIQAREGIETQTQLQHRKFGLVTIQAREGIETP